VEREGGREGGREEGGWPLVLRLKRGHDGGDEGGLGCDRGCLRSVGCPGPVWEERRGGREGREGGEG